MFMKNLLLLTVLLVSSQLFGQEIDLYMTQSNYDKLPNEMKLTVKGKVKIIDENSGFKTENKDANNKSTSENEQALKNWLAENQQVKIVKRSEFNVASNTQQEIYLTNGTMVLIGERITYEDIINYK